MFGARAFKKTASIVRGLLPVRCRRTAHDVFQEKAYPDQVLAATTPKAVRKPAEIMIKTTKKPDSDGQHRRMLRTVEDNRIL